MSRKSGKIAIGFAILAAIAFVIGFHPSRPLYMKQSPIDVIAPDRTKLRATLSWPRWKSRPRAAMVLVHGSGRLARIHLIGDVRRLVWEGYAVLAYDKRGVGESGGRYPEFSHGGAEAALRVLAGDAAAALARMRIVPNLDPDSIGFFGASQAGWIIPLVARTLDRPPRFQIILSGPAVSTGVEHFYSDLTGDGSRAPVVTDPTEIRRLLRNFDGETGYDPLPDLLAIRVPCLWLLGDRDLSVPTFATAEVLEDLPAEVAAYHTVIRFPEAGHDLRDVRTGKPVEVWEHTNAWLRKVGVTPPR